MAQLTLEPLSSRNEGQNQTLIDLTGSLGSTETISTVNVTAVNAAVITVQSATTNGGPVTEGGVTVATGKGVLLVVSAIAAYRGNQELRMRIVGSDQFKRDYEIIQPVDIAISK
jgi:hypothetical protein